MRWAPGLLVLAACVTAPTPVKPDPEPKIVVAPVADSQAELHSVVNAFISATEARRFELVLALLAQPLRARYSAALLERDFGADPVAPERLSRLKLKSNQPLQEAQEGASLEWAEGRSLRLVHEPEGWRISALE